MSSDIAIEIGQLISQSREGEDDSIFSFPSPISWTPAQQAVIDEIVAWRRSPTSSRFFKLIGPAGTGKTAILQEVRRRLLGTRTAWTAMTGKAVRRLREASHIPAKTLHAVLFHPPQEIDNVVDHKIDLQFEQIKEDGASCLLVIDEASMISSKLFFDIERSPYEKILIVGDIYQLPAISNQEQVNFSVFENISGPQLNDVIRTDGAVLIAAHHVREKQEVFCQRVESGGSVYEYIRVQGSEDALNRAAEMYLSDSHDHAVITWTNVNRMLLNGLIRYRLGHFGDRPCIGERVVVRKNSYFKKLLNGELLEVMAWEEAGPTLAGIPTQYMVGRTEEGREVRFLVPVKDFSGVLPYVGLSTWKTAIQQTETEDPIPVTYAYCLTAHMSQGSEYRRVTVVLPGDWSNPYFHKATKLSDGKETKFMTQFIYTTISRAKKQATLIIS